ncbi:MAG: biotin/lipoyl-binding protein [Nitrospirae bacterium]|nr:MAG: biotin/lipoyl-binding protein [Nitrospirota bacterium]
MIVTRLSFWFALGGVLLTVMTLWAAREKPAPPPPLQPPPVNPYPETVAGAGIVEAVRENVRIAPPVAGLVTQVFVNVGDSVAEGAPLFQVDDRDLRAQLLTRERAIPAARATVAEQRVAVRDLLDQLRRLEAVEDRRAVSIDALQRKRFEVVRAKRALVRAQAELALAVAQRDETRRLIDRLTVRAPRDGTILQVNIRAGEYATPNGGDPPIVLGETQQLQVRTDIDEVNAPLVRPGSPAVAYLKGRTDFAIPLTFERIEPFVVPKRSLTGDNQERVDTRVLQVIYRFEQPDFPVYVGQQVDVFIERAPANGEAASGSPAHETPLPNNNEAGSGHGGDPAD